MQVEVQSRIDMLEHVGLAAVEGLRHSCRREGEEGKQIGKE